MGPIWDYEVKYLYGLDENVDNSVIEELLKNDVDDFLAKIDYIGLNGKVRETCYFINRDFYIETVNNDEWYGEPMIKRQLKGDRINWDKGDPQLFFGIKGREQTKSSELERSLF